MLNACSFPFAPEKKAGLSVTATPNAGIFLNDSHIGSTPYYNEKIKAGEYTLKIVPENGVGLSWESKVKLMPGIITVISRQLSQTEESSSGYFLTLEPGGQKDKSGIEIITLPDKSVITIDGESKGFSPLSLDNLSPGEHVVLVTAPGYIDRSINANLRTGHILRVSVQLSRAQVDSPVETADGNSIDTADVTEDGDEILDSKPTPSIKPTAKPLASTKPVTDLEKPYVTVQETPTGFLNVREEPTTATDNILAKIKPGESYSYLEKNNSGWYKIEISPGEVGWISSKYVKLVEE